MNFGKFSGYTFEKFLWIYRWYFYDLNGTTPYLGKLGDPPPRAPGPINEQGGFSSGNHYKISAK